MNKKEQFKNVARLHPELVNYIKSGEMTWQKFYEIYDIYGESQTAWDPYIPKISSSNTNPDITNTIQDKIKNIDMNSIQEHIKTAQKALSLVSELTGKSSITPSNAIPKVPRPINQFFED